MARALVPPTLVCTTLRRERPARPWTAVPGSPLTGAADQVPTQVPAETGATALPESPRRAVDGLGVAGGAVVEGRPDVYDGGNGHDERDYRREQAITMTPGHGVCDSSYGEGAWGSGGLRP